MIRSRTAHFSVAVGDLDGDSRPDLVTANYTSASVSVLLADGAGPFAGTTATSRCRCTNSSWR